MSGWLTAEVPCEACKGARAEVEGVHFGPYRPRCASCDGKGLLPRWRRLTYLAERLINAACIVCVLLMIGAVLLTSWPTFRRVSVFTLMMLAASAAVISYFERIRRRSF
jgi:hypothetical protein